MAVEELLFDISDALRIPVLILAVVALVVVLVELGLLVAELLRRRGRNLARLEYAVDEAQREVRKGDDDAAIAMLEGVSFNRAMGGTMAALIEERGKAGGRDRISKRLADYDYLSLKHLERTRILVRFGPALGLMGTLIPLSPALAGLADGNVNELTDNLRVAFSVTVAGLLVGAIAFAISLVRDRIYAQDFSDVEYAASRLADLPRAKPKAKAKAGARKASAKSAAKPRAAAKPKAKAKAGATR